MIQYRNDLIKLIELYNLPKIAVEVGVAEGYFAADMLRWGLDKLYMVDFWGKLEQAGDGGNDAGWHDKNYKEAVERVKEFGDKAVILRGVSWEMASQIPDNSCGLVNVDCDHSYTGVMRDILAWYPKLVVGGIMSFHDYEMPQYGVKQAVQYFAGGHNLEIHLLPENKKEDAGAYFFKK